MAKRTRKPVAVPAAPAPAPAPIPVVEADRLAEGKFSKPYQCCVVLKSVMVHGVLLRKGSTVVLGKRMTEEAWRQNAVKITSEQDE